MCVTLYKRMYDSKLGTKEDIKVERFKAWSIANITATKLGVIIDYTEERR